MSRLIDVPVVHYEGETGAGSGGGAVAPAPQPAAAPPAPVAAPAPAAQGQPDGGDRIRQLEKELSDARQEAAGYRTGNKGQMKEFREAMGLKADEDLASFSKRLQNIESENRRLKLDGALADVYGKHGVDPKLARALLVADGLHAALNPDDVEFSKTINGHVKKLAEDFPAIRLAVTAMPNVPPRSGPDLPPGGAGAPPQLTKADIEGMKPEQVTKALRDGQLNNLLKRTQ